MRRRHRSKNTELGRFFTFPKLSWIKKQLFALQPIAERCHNVIQEHPFGVVYAVKFMPADCSALVYHGSMGLISFAPITPDRLIAKVRIPADLNYETCGDRRRLDIALANIHGVWSCARPQ